MGKSIVFVMGEKSHLIALRCAVGVFPPGLQKKKKRKKKNKNTGWCSCFFYTSLEKLVSFQYHKQG